MKKVLTTLIAVSLLLATGVVYSKGVKEDSNVPHTPPSKNLTLDELKEIEKTRPQKDIPLNIYNPEGKLVLKTTMNYWIKNKDKIIEEYNLPKPDGK